MLITRLCVPVGFLCWCVSAVVAQSAPGCAEHAWFTGPALLTPLCRGIRDAEFDRRAQALRELKGVLEQAPPSAEVYQAYEPILQMDVRQGRYGEALAEADKMLAIRSDAEDVVEVRPLLVALAAFPAMSVRNRHSFIPYAPAPDPNPHLPVLVNSKRGLFFVDTGANISIMSDAEATALGLEVKPVTSRMGGITGKATALSVTQVRLLQIGRTTLRNVPFVVLPATKPPFDDLPAEQQGVLGIQVLRALGRIRMEKDGRMELDGRRAGSGHATPMVFSQSNPVVQMETAGRTLLFTLDTGAEETLLYRTFAEMLPESVSGGTRQDHVLNGLSGSTHQESTQLATVSFLLAGQTVTLSPATLLLDTTVDTSRWTGGNLGYDLIQQAAPWVLDFKTMTFSSGR